MKATICLVMILRNEQDFIWSTLEAINGRVDYAIFLDSESTDESVHLIKTYMSGTGIPFEVHNYTKPFRGDEKRTAAIDLAKGKADYLLVLDADNTLELEYLPQIVFGRLEHDAYYITKKMGGIDYPILALFRGSMDWQFTGIIHDYPELKSREHFTCELLPGIVIHEPVKEETGRRKKTKADFYKDALVIEREIVDNAPNIPVMLMHRYLFYTAQSYRDAGLLDRALEAYKVRVLQAGWEEEVFYSLLSIARIKMQRQDPAYECMAAALEAWNYRPQRLEAAYLVMTLFYNMGLLYTAYTIGKASDGIFCNDKLFIERDTYTVEFPAMMEALCAKFEGVSPD